MSGAVEGREPMTRDDASLQASPDRRAFLSGGAAMLGGAVLLAGCGSSSSPGASATKRPPIGKEPGTLSILEWGGYEADGTKAQTNGLMAGKDYTAKFGGSSITYTYITNDDQALEKATAAGPFDIMHPCHENIPDYVSRGLVQPWDTSLIPSFKQLNPYLVKKGQINGKQYMIPWDWGYGSLTYRTDKVSPADATGWELAWNKKYAGRISLWSGASTDFEIAALKLGFPKMDDMTSSQLAQAKAQLLTQKPLNKFYWESEYSQMQPAFKSGTIWIAYSWQDTLVAMQAAGLKVAFMNPSQGRLSWLCGFMLGAKTEEYYHAHDYVESFINHDACAQMTNLYYYGTSNATVKPSEIKNKALVEALKLGDPHAIAASDVHLQSWSPNRAALELAWQEVQAA
jgi:spermidine/putrescine transport system substrate-binding protein